MILDSTQLYSDDQALTTTAVSTNVIDHGLIGSSANPRNIGRGNHVRLMVLVTVALVGGTSLEVHLQTGSTATPTTIIAESQAIVAATLVAGYRFDLQFIPDLVERFTRINYVIVGTFTAGQVTTALLDTVQSWSAP